MSLNSVEWSQAQDLLMKLVAVLAPLTDVQGDTPEPVVLHKPFFIPPSKEESHLLLRHAVQLLPTLRNVQKEVDEWITEVPTAPIAKEPPVRSDEKTPPIYKQAQRLILQVQQAIGKLCTSTNIKNPEEAPLKETLQKIKPSLDRIIESVKEGEKEISLEPAAKNPSFQASPSFSKRLPLPSPLVPLSPREMPRFVHPLTKLVKRGGEGREENPIDVLHPKEKRLPVFLEEALPPSQDLLSIPEEERSAPPAPLDRTVLPAAPFILPMKNLPLTAPKKKKRARFWSREDEEEERNNP